MQAVLRVGRRGSSRSLTAGLDLILTRCDSKNIRPGFRDFKHSPARSVIRLKRESSMMVARARREGDLVCVDCTPSRSVRNELLPAQL